MGTTMGSTSKVIGAITTYEGTAIEGRRGDWARICKVLRDHFVKNGEYTRPDDPESYITSDRVLAQLGGVKATDRLEVMFVDVHGEPASPASPCHYDLAAVDFEMFAHLKGASAEPTLCTPAHPAGEGRGRRREPAVDYEVDDVVLCLVTGKGLVAGAVYSVYAVSRRRTGSGLLTTVTVNADFALIEVDPAEPVLRRTRVQVTRKVQGGSDKVHTFQDVIEFESWRAANDVSREELYGLRYVEIAWPASGRRRQSASVGGRVPTHGARQR
jgi:hypothetical protein